MKIGRYEASGNGVKGTVDLWGSLGVFLLGSGAGAITTATYYSSQIRQLKQLIESTSAPQERETSSAENDEDEQRKSA